MEYPAATVTVTCKEPTDLSCHVAQLGGDVWTCSPALYCHLKVSVGVRVSRQTSHHPQLYVQNTSQIYSYSVEHTIHNGNNVERQRWLTPISFPGMKSSCSCLCKGCKTERKVGCPMDSIMLMKHVYVKMRLSTEGKWRRCINEDWRCLSTWMWIGRMIPA